MTHPDPTDRPVLDRFRTLIAHHFGLAFDDSKLALLREVLGRRLADTNSKVTTYLHRLVSPDSRELRALARELTVGETYFFRNFNHFRALSDLVLPERIAARGELRRLEILSAGCSSGEEVYSLAALASELHLDARWHVHVRGIDVNAASLAKAKRGVYSLWSLREVPDELRRRWFDIERGQVVVRPAMRASVRFDERNLVDDDPELWAPERWDVIFCRNVLMYFEQPVARAIIARMAASLQPGGYLFLGHAETLRELSVDFDLMNTHDTFYYRKLPSAGTREVVWPVVKVSPEPTPDLGADWIETIRLTAERIRRLSEQAAPSEAHPTIDVDRALVLLEQERYVEGLTLFEGHDDAQLDPMSALLLAVLQIHSGLLSAAERSARRLIARGLREPDAEHVLSLCSEKAGDHAAAIAHDRRATELDPSFAMPRLHLGLMAHVDGDRAAVEDELGRASELLEREDRMRLVLFGGGFGRDALIGMCRTTMQRAGSRA